MGHESTSGTSPGRRRFGVGGLVAAMVASGVVAAGGTWFLAHRHGGEEHAGAAAEAKEIWQCPMHPSIVQDHPGDCPICGMKLVKVAGGAAAGGESAPAAEAKETWQCPMHPSIVQDHPGDCPICGMKLVKVAGGAAVGGEKGSGMVVQEEGPAQWQCPMHPSIVQDHPGDCPICGMKLVQIEGGSKVAVGEASDPEGLVAVTIDAARQQLIGLKVAHVERAPVGGSWRTSGRVAVDETRIHHVNVKFSGFMEHVHGDFVGRAMRKGEPLFSIYSPELLAAQQEYLLALDTRGRLGGEERLAADGEALVQAARRKLELWDVPRSEIERIQRSGRASRTITFFSPASGVITKKDVVPGMRVNAGDMPFEIVDLSRVWLLADAYETDLRHVHVGQAAKLTLKAFPDRTFQGRVAFIDPFLEPRTRTAKVRVEFPNRGGELKPEMFGEVVIEGKRREGLRIPADAVIHSGTKSVVFVALPDGKFRPREIELGEGDADFVEVVSGLEEGDGVVTRANFLVDSESRLRASLSALSSAAAPSASAAPAPAPSAGGEHAGHGR